MAIPTQAEPVAGQRYLLLADISGYTAFLNGVERAHGVDFSSGIPAGYEVLGALLDAVVEGVQPAFEIAKLEGDAVFAVAPAEGLDGQGEAVLDRLRAVHRAFYVVREHGKSASDHICTARVSLGRGTALFDLAAPRAVDERYAGWPVPVEGGRLPCDLLGRALWSGKT